MYRKTLPILFLVLFSSVASANFIGISPAAATIGEIPPGTSRTYVLHITSNSVNRKFTVTPKFKDPQGDLYGGNGLVNNPEKISEQDIGDWITFNKEKYSVDPSTEYQTRIAGTIINAVGNMTMTVTVPSDAEPGYHAGRIRPNTKIGAPGQGYGAKIKALQDFNFAFKVPGPVQKSFQIADMRAVRTGENKIRIDTYLRNTGTVTTSLEGGKADVLDFKGKKIGVIDIPQGTVGRGDIKTVSETIKSDRIRGGDFQVDGKVRFRPTGMIPLQGIVEVPDQIRFVAPEDGAPEGVGEGSGSKEDLPIWLVGMVLVVLGVVMHSFEIDPAVILLFVAVLGVITMILMTEISNLYLLIIAVGITALYYML